MNAYASQMNNYKNNQILNASPEQILIMLYDGAIRFCREALMAMDEGDLRRQADRISRAMAIVSEFSNTLNHQTGGEIAENLDGLYAFMNRELVRANLERDPAGVQTVENLLSGLRETWLEAIEINRKAAPAAKDVAVSAEASAQATQAAQTPNTPPVPATYGGYGPAGQSRRIAVSM